MKKRYPFFAILTVFLVIISYFFITTKTEITASTIPQEPIQLCSIPAPSLQNNLLEEPSTRRIKIYLPKSYSTANTRYPTLYFLPGFGDSFERYGLELQESMEHLATQNKLSEMIIVIIDGTNRLHGSFYVNSPVTGNWEDFIVHDVVDYVDKNYRTLAAAPSRGIAGHSMGGFGALNLAMLYPDTFSAVYSMSPAILGDNALSQFVFNFTLENPYSELTPTDARNKYLESLPTITWPEDFLYAYGSAFVPAPEKAPYIHFADSSLSPEAIKSDLIWQAWGNGIGNWAGKINQHQTNLQKLTAIAIDYGKQDEFTWIPNGCTDLSRQLKQADIPHELLSYEGNHLSHIRSRMEEFMLPFFAKHLQS